jgi:FMN phosphatase YigB (HAD superfamily)
VLQLANQSKAILSFNDEVSFYAAVFGHLSERFGRKHDHQDLIDLAVEFVSVPFELFPGVIESLRSLQDRYELGILSDAHPTRRAAELTYLGLLPFFRVVLISGEVGFDKSEPEFFAQAIVAAQTEAKHLQLIDNSPEPLCISLSCGFTKGVLIGHELSDDWETDQTVEALTTRLLIKRP